MAIEIHDLKKTYPRSLSSAPYEALRGISLAIPQGEVFGFIGPNGAGKSTVIKILTGVMRATSGSARLFGKDVADPLARRNLGYVPENPSLPDYLTPMEVLKMVLQLHKVHVDKPTQHCLKWLERFELAHVANKTIRGFSKGMAQRTALAQALVVKPRLLILDEPLSGLDPVGRKDVVDILSEYKSTGGSVFLTSHVLHDVERLGDRFGLIHKGQLQTVQSPRELATEDEKVLVRTLGESPIAGMVAESDGRWRIEVMRSELWTYLHTIESYGHLIVEIKPSLSLEALFMRVVGENQVKN